MKKLCYLIVLTLILGLALTGCFLSNVGQVPATGQKGMPSSTANLVSLWHFDEGSGTTVADSNLINGNDGTVSGATWAVDGKLGKALSFDGINNYVEVPDSTSLMLSNVTVECWVKSGSPGSTKYIVAKYYNSGRASYGLYTRGGGLCFYVSDASTYYLSTNAGSGVWDDEWHHIAGTYDGSTVRLYVDGSEVGTGNTVNKTIEYLTGNLYVGSYGTGFYFNGIIDEVRIWGGALTEGEIFYSYNDETLHVDDDWDQWPGAYYTINEALAVAGDGDTIKVHEGTYDPFTVDGKTNLTIQSSSTVIVQGVQVVTTNYTNRDAVIFVKDSVNIVLEGLTIGPNTDQTQIKDYSIIYENSSGEINNCTVSPNTAGDLNSVAIGVWDGSNVTIDTCIIENFGRIGVFVYNGCTAIVLNSTIIGQVYSGSGEVCYGIEVEAEWDSTTNGSQVTITGNEIYNCDNTSTTPEPEWGSSGILINGWLEWYADKDDCTVIIENNDIHNNYGGIYVIKSSLSYAHFNNIYDNREYGVESAKAADDTTAVFDATCNWWGHPGGPRRPAGNSGKISGPKDADQVSENVLYHPWLNDEFEWQPTDVGGLVLWLDAGSIQGADVRPIGSWKDSSGQGNHAKQDDSTRQPTYIALAEEELNSQPVVRFDGSNDWMYAPYESTLTEKTMFVVARFNSLVNSSPDSQSRVYVMGLAQINSGWHTTEFKSTYGNWRGRIYDGSGKWVEGSSVVDEQWKLLSLRAVNDEVIEFWEEGTSKGTTAIGTMWTEHNIVAIGANGAPVGFLNGDIAEILIFDRALSNHERQRIERYLNDKYDIY